MGSFYVLYMHLLVCPGHASVISHGCVSDKTRVFSKASLAMIVQDVWLRDASRLDAQHALIMECLPSCRVVQYWQLMHLCTLPTATAPCHTLAVPTAPQLSGGSGGQHAPEHMDCQ
jgi:hypothetical protein